jgi:Flp pilus assembly protein TadD
MDRCSPRVTARTLSYVAGLVAIVAVSGTVAGDAVADSPPHARPPNVAAQQTDGRNAAEAKKHFETARGLYQKGAYREAIVELETALKLDPGGKELVYNLGVLHEKLGDIDDALQYFRRYAEMDLTAQEREKTDAAVRRLEGAKKEIEAKRVAEQREQEKQPPPPPPSAHEPPPPERGRIDALSIGAASLAVGGLAFGTFFAVKASADKPKSGFVTGKDGTFDDLQTKATNAHREAVLADVGFGVGIAAGVGAVLLYVMRVKDAPPASTTTTGKTTSISATPLPGGAALVLGGRF